MATSTVPAAKAGLLALFKARAGLATVQVEWAHPGDNIEPESLFFHETRDDETAVALGQRRRDENYYLDLIVTVHQEGDDAQAVETRMWALVAEVEQALRNVATGAIAANVLWAQVAGKTSRIYAEAAGRTAECTVPIAVRARI